MNRTPATMTFGGTIGLLLALSSGVSAQDWPHWRGPNYDGSTEATGLPIAFDKEKNVKWRVDMPGIGAGTPIVLGDRVFVTSIDDEKDKLVAMCLDRKTGKTLWRHEAGSGYRPEGASSEIMLHNKSNYASPSPT